MRTHQWQQVRWRHFSRPICSTSCLFQLLATVIPATDEPGRARRLCWALRCLVLALAEVMERRKAVGRRLAGWSLRTASINFSMCL
jgi:hypothetical protein